MDTAKRIRPIDITTSPDLLLEHEALVTEALRRAVRQAVREHKRAGNSIAVWKDDRVVLIAAEDIVIDDEERTDHSNGSA